MRGRLFLAAATVAVLAASSCKKEVPASLLLTVKNAASTAPAEVRVRVFDAQGQSADFTTFPVSAAPASGVLGTVVIYPRTAAAVLRVQAQGWVGGDKVSEGTRRAELGQTGQATAEVVLADPASVADGDRDGVPDDIDNCGQRANPTQSDADGDGVGDGCADADGGTDGYVPRRPIAAVCTTAAECESGHCVDGVCCESDCTDVCRSCKLPEREGRCAPVAAGQPDPRSGCNRETPESCGFDGTCNGAGGCRRHPAGTVCGAAGCISATDRMLPGTCDGNGGCSPSRSQSCVPFACADGACRLTCSAAGDCAPGSVCSMGSCGRKPLGSPCQAGAECNSGFCVDGVCCDVADCGGPCKACNVAGAAGSCQNLAANAEPRATGCASEAVATCGRTGKCDGTGGCQLHAAGTPCGPRTCSGDTETGADICNGLGVCVPGTPRSCGNYACVEGTGCRTTCGGSGDCQPAASCLGDRCVLRKPLGMACDAAGECASGFCNDGVCCDQACTEPCRRCDGSPVGTCQLLTTGRDANATPSCNPPRRCIAGGVCE
jgi:hypothetical protein